MTKTEYQKAQEDTSGTYGGLGIVISHRPPQGFFIQNVEPKSPAANAGLLKGDQVISVDGTSITKASLSQLASKIRGLPDTKILLGIRRNSWDQAREILLIRKRVLMQSTSHQLLKPQVGYIAIRSFQESTETEVKESLKALHESSGGKMIGIILDLRDNPGGLFDQGVAVADLFLDSGRIVSTESRHQQHKEIQNASSAGTDTKQQLVLLVNQHTASSSEIVAGALKDHGRALLLGQATYGKGSVQTLIGLEDGSGLKLTVAHYNTPEGTPIPSSGIVPNKKLEAPESEPLSVSDDPWIKAGLEHLLQNAP